jgi:hypothetical protein
MIYKIYFTTLPCFVNIWLSYVVFSQAFRCYNYFFLLLPDIYFIFGFDGNKICKLEVLGKLIKP